MMKVVWKEFNNINNAILNARNEPAIYVFASKIEFEGLPENIDYNYIGQSRVLHRRLKEHLPFREKNAGLKHWLVKNYNKHIVKFAYFDEENLDSYEKNYIKHFKPNFNILHNNRR
jgi:excinuclease UvrABC nuclease subunit